MKIDKRLESGTLIIAPKGRLDAQNAEEFQRFFERESPGADALKIDLCGLDYISSAGLRVLLHIHKSCEAAGKSYRITGCKETVADILQMTGFADALCVELA